MELIDQGMAADLRLRWERMRGAMLESGADGCLLTGDVNLYYATGRVYNGYFYLPAEGDPWLFVRRPAGLAGERTASIRKPEQLPELFAERGIRLPERPALEADELTYSDYLRLAAALSVKDAVNATALLRRVRMVKTPWEIARFRLSAAAHVKTYREIPACFRPGMTDLELQYAIEQRMRQNGSIGLFRTFGANMDIFMGSLLAGDNAETPSPFDFALGGGGVDSLPIGANGMPLREGTTVMVDMAGNYTAYITDLTRVFSIGRLPDAAYRAHRVSQQIEEAVVEAARPGTSCAGMYQTAVSIAQREGLAGCFMGTRQQAQFVGHGIGLQINEPPVLTPRSKETLEAGMVFALEPKFVLPGIGAVGIENSFLVTPGGLEKLTVLTEDIINLL